MTILGHVQRGGTPSAYDRWMSTLLGYAAVQEILASSAEDEPVILGVRRNRITRILLMKAVHDTCPDTYIRPDHGRMIWDEKGRPGYGLYDRALGATYLNGLWEAICRNED